MANPVTVCAKPLALKLPAPEALVKAPSVVNALVSNCKVPAPVCDTLKNALPPEFRVCVPEPALNVTVLEFAANVPLLDQLPETVNVFEPEMVSVAPELIVMLLQTAAAPIDGWLPPTGITTFVAAVGTAPPHQLEPVCQSVLVYPSQVPVTQDEAETFRIPVFAAK